MKKLLLFALFFVYVLSVSTAQNFKVLLDYNTYCTDKQVPYVEFMFLIGGKSVKYAEKKDNQYLAEVELSVVVEQNNVAIDSFTYVITSDVYKDTLLANKLDFADKLNYKINEGEYILYFSIRDLNNPLGFAKYIDNIKVAFPKDKVSASSITLLNFIEEAKEDDFFAKHGYNIPPLFGNFYNKSMNILSYFMEVYNTQEILGIGKTFYIESRIASAENNWIDIPKISRKEVYSTTPVTVVLQELDLSKLPSGNYHLIVDVLDNESNLLASKYVFFQRSNPAIELDVASYTNKLTPNTFAAKYSNLKILQDYVASLYPIATSFEQEFFDKRMKIIPLEQLQSFFYTFWDKRAPGNPEKAWLEYNDKVKYVQNVYGSKIQKGYRTDRGRVYLKYGPPNSITESPFTASMYPYEVWHYYHAEGESNVKFIFYNTDLVSNEYVLLHSTKTGETKEPAWQLRLLKDHLPQSDFDITRPENFWGNDMDDNWRNP